MAWSTREVAELAGVSLRAVRHYHEQGLLDAPHRFPNGYKQYDVTHLRRLVSIKRLIGLGFPLPQIAAMGDPGDDPAESLRILDGELVAIVAGLQRARVELAFVLEVLAPVDVPLTPRSP